MCVPRTVRTLKEFSHERHYLYYRSRRRHNRGAELFRPALNDDYAPGRRVRSAGRNRALSSSSIDAIHVTF
jgi:hypothetical protein